MQDGEHYDMLRKMPPNSSVKLVLWQVPRLIPEQRWLGGVAAAIASEVGVEALAIRLAFVLLTLSNGIGLALYAGCWLWFTYVARARLNTLRSRGATDDYRPLLKATSDAKRWLGVGSIVLGLVLLTRNLFPPSMKDGTLWPVAVATFGLLLAWSSGKVDWSQPRELVRAGGGLGLIASGVIAFIALNFGRSLAPQALLIATGVLSLVVVIVAPWLWRAASQVGEQRIERTRAEERAEFAAHLHDSVLQTLSLIIRNADDPAMSRQLARRQERELRQWLFGKTQEAGKPQSFRIALSQLAGEVEDLHGVPIEIVVVGDGPLTDTTHALLGATREALVNAARHACAKKVDLYGEYQDDSIEIYVRDKGKGFDKGTVAPDRQGLAESVYGRMLRVGGSATITSQLGEGTEVALSLPLTFPLKMGNKEPGRT